MGIGLIITLLLLSVPWVVYLIGKRGETDWRRTARAFAKAFRKHAPFVAAFILAVTALNRAGIINYNVGGLIMTFWPVALIAVGIRNLFAKDFSSKVSGIVM